jgi:plastocyanin
MRTLSVLTLATALAACSKPDGATPSAEAAPVPATAAPDAAPTPDPDRKVIEIKMMTAPDGQNKFEPAEFEAHRGDVLHFVLEAGVHNVDFLPDSNPGKAGLPKASDMLQLPGQSFDVKVTWEPGKYYFQCDPHALLGMVGRVEVED